jgi:hypothetical protein
VPLWSGRGRVAPAAVAEPPERVVDGGPRLPFDSPATSAYVKSIVVRMIDHQFERLGVEPSIIIVARPTLSAWVYPYGDIAVTTGLLAGMRNDAQLAAILGQVIPSSVFQNIRDAMTAQGGGLTTAAGEYDLARAQAVRDHSFREMQFRHTYDAVVVARIVQVAAPWKNDRAEWDGTKQTIQHKGGGRYAGKLPALSLLVVFVDRSGRPLYQAYGGLEVLVRRDKQRLVPLESVDLWKDPKRANKAVSIALDAL